MSKIEDHLDEALGDGEREAISLAIELLAGTLLIDELAGRKEAQARNLTVTGTLNVLMHASLLGRCEFTSAVAQLRALGFWVSASIESLMSRRHAELLSKKN